MSATKDRRQQGTNLHKLVFELEPDQWHGFATETLWAERITRNTFRLKNVPFFAFGYSYGDVVKAGAGNTISAAVLHSGHSTYRLRPVDNEPVQSETMSRLLALGVVSEEGPLGIIALDVEPRADIYAVYELLAAGEADGLWHFDEGHCGHRLHSSSS